MFDTVEVGHELSSRQFEQLEPALRLRLLQAQQKLNGSRASVIVIVCGVETSGRNRGVNRLNSWLDPRGVQVTGFWRDLDGEPQRPPHWRYWRRLPPRGKIGILFGAWYEQIIMDRADKSLDKAAFAAEMQRITALERMLAEDGAVIVKLWFHVSKAERARRMHAIRHLTDRGLTAREQQYSRNFDRMLKSAADAIHATDTGKAPWHLIDAADARYRDILTGQIIADSIEQRLTQHSPPTKARRRVVPAVGKHVTVLDSVNLSARMPERRYEHEMLLLRSQLNTLAWQAHESRHSHVLMFEGWDGSGKGGAIRRVVSALDARLTQVIQTAAPSDEERAHHYLWRFWRHLPPAGYITIYDRSWYGRVLVERIENLASPLEWERAYGEINDFEEQLHENRICLIKFWLHISKDEQLRRFRAREHTAFKRHKITPDDWRNREKWREYELAVDEMVARTSTAHSPWTLVAGNDKRHARIMVMRTLIERMEQAAGG